MKIVPVIEFSVRNTTVFIRHINIAAASIDDAMAKFKEWHGKRTQSDAYVICCYETLPVINPSSGQDDGILTVEEYERWRKTMLFPTIIDGEEVPPVWHEIL